MPQYLRRTLRFKTPSRTSPRNKYRGCLCPDGTYSRKCCDGSLQAQGVGSITRNNRWEAQDVKWEGANENWNA